MTGSSGWALALLISGGLALLGSIFVTIGTARARRTRGWVPTRGWICGRDGAMDGVPDTYPTFAWHGPDGRLHRHTSSAYGGLYRKGRQVEVLVDPRDPQRAQLRGFIQSGTSFVVIGAAILGCAVIGGLGTVLALYAVRSGWAS